MLALGIGGDQDARLLRLHGDDGGGQPHFDRRQMRVGHDWIDEQYGHVMSMIYSFSCVLLW